MTPSQSLGYVSCPEVGGSKFLRNVTISDYATSHPIAALRSQNLRKPFRPSEANRLHFQQTPKARLTNELRKAMAAKTKAAIPHRRMKGMGGQVHIFITSFVLQSHTTTTAFTPAGDRWPLQTRGTLYCPCRESNCGHQLTRNARNRDAGHSPKNGKLRE